jgi:thiopurine S-methyltransferase
MDQRLDQQYWIKRWAEGRIGFHLKGFNPLLERFWPQVAVAEGGRVLVPFCGKSEDLRWLAERGHDVVGVDLSPIAAKAFAEEQAMELSETQEPPFTVFRGNGITFYAGDFLSLTPGVAGHFDLFYDRAAIIALPPAKRPAYAQHLQSFIAPGGKGLLISLEYDMSTAEGPPFSVPEHELQTLFSKFQTEKLLDYDCLDSEPRFKERGVKWMREIVYAIR